MIGELRCVYAVRLQRVEHVRHYLHAGRYQHADGRWDASLPHETLYEASRAQAVQMHWRSQDGLWNVRDA